MDVLDTLTSIMRYCGRVVKLGADIQEPTRATFVSDLQGICSNAEDSYGQVLRRLLPIKNSSNNPAKLAIELHMFHADVQTRDQFKPDHLCGRVDQILVDLASNLSPLKYSLDISRLKQMRTDLGVVGKFDGQFYASYNNLTSGLDQLGLQIENSLSANRPAEAGDAAKEALHQIAIFEDELRTAIADMRDVKDRILHG